MQRRAPVGPIERSFHVLQCVGSARVPLTLTELSESTSLDKATTYRLATKLVELGMLERDEDGKFRVGLRVLDLGFSYLDSLDLRTLALPSMRRLQAEYDGAVSLSILDGAEIVYIERIAPRRMQASMSPGIGARLPVHCTAMGKMMLAFLEPAQRTEILESLDFNGWTENTVRTREQFVSDLDVARVAGFAVTDQEMIDGIRAAGAAILNRFGVPVGAVSIALSAHAHSLEELIASIGPRVLQAGNEITALLGARNLR